LGESALYQTITHTLEALLFASGEAVEAAKLAVAVSLDEETVIKILRGMADLYRQENRGILIMEFDGSFQMCTNQLYFDAVAKLTQIPAKKALTAVLLETLAIIAYKQPVTKAQIEEIRGVNADHAVNRLMEYGLVAERGRLDAPGKPILLGTSEEFLKYFGLESLGKMPEMPEAGAGTGIENRAEADSGNDGAEPATEDAQ